MPPSDQNLNRRDVIAMLSAQLGLLGLVGCGAAATSSSPAVTLPVQPANPNPQPIPAGTLVLGTVIVTFAAKAPIPQGFCGLSYEKSSISRQTLSTRSTGIVRLFQLLNGRSVLRVGGNSGDNTVYKATGAGNISGQVANKDIDLFAAFAKAVNCQVIYGINLGGFFDSPPTQTAALAAAEAVYAANALGSSLQQFEIGNEPDLYTTSTGAKVTYAQFVAAWESVALAIRQAIPTATFAGPSIASTGNISTWSVPFAAAEKSKGLALLTQHRYVADEASSSATDATLLNDVNSSSVAANMQTLKSTAAAQGITWSMSETGSFYDSAAGTQALDFASALWVIDYLFTNAFNGASQVNIHNGNLLKYSNFVPFNDDEVNTITSVNNIFYGMLLFALGGYGTAVQTSISTSAAATAYSIQVDPTHYSIWILNKDTTSTQNLAMTVSLPSAIKSATITVMTGTAMNAQSGTKIQGAAVGADGSFAPAASYTLAISGSSLTCYVPVNSAVLVQTVLS